MKRLQEETMCKMAVLGRGSMKDRKKVKSQEKKNTILSVIENVSFCVL